MRTITCARLSALLTVLVSAGAAGCTGSSDSTRDLVDRSTADVLVPTDERFLDTWSFDVQDSPDNYTFRSNWSPSFDPDVDPDLIVVGYQVSDPTAWSGGDETGGGQAEREAVVAAVADSTSPGADVPCAMVESSPEIVGCAYDVGGPEGPMEILVRRFPESSTVVIVITANDAAVDYLSGDFESFPIGQATERWLAG